MITLRRLVLGLALALPLFLVIPVELARASPCRARCRGNAGVCKESCKQRFPRGPARRHCIEGCRIREHRCVGGCRY